MCICEFWIFTTQRLHCLSISHSVTLFMIRCKQLPIHLCLSALAIALALSLSEYEPHFMNYYQSKSNSSKSSQKTIECRTEAIIQFFAKLIEKLKFLHIIDKFEWMLHMLCNFMVKIMNIERHWFGIQKANMNQTHNSILFNKKNCLQATSTKLKDKANPFVWTSSKP